MITTANFEITKVENLTSDYIETELKNFNIEPLRWAIIDEKENCWIVSSSYKLT